MFEELERANFQILPDADATVVIGYVRAIAKWELEWVSFYC
jgi:hypothetical protein